MIILMDLLKKHNWYNVAMEYKNIIDKYSKNGIKIKKDIKNIENIT